MLAYNIWRCMKMLARRSGSDSKKPSLMKGNRQQYRSNRPAEAAVYHRQGGQRRNRDKIKYSSTMPEPGDAFLSAFFRQPAWPDKTVA